jgi:hypothetical protein
MLPTPRPLSLYPWHIRSPPRRAGERKGGWCIRPQDENAIPGAKQHRVEITKETDDDEDDDGGTNCGWRSAEARGLAARDGGGRGGDGGGWPDSRGLTALHVHQRDHATGAHGRAAVRETSSPEAGILLLGEP